MKPPTRIFLDSNVLIEGICAEWSNARAVLILARTKAFTLVLSPYVEEEVENALLARLQIDDEEGSRFINAYDRALRVLEPEHTPRITPEEYRAHRSWIRHLNDVPVLVTAIKALPDYLITSNTEHFTPEVAARTGLRIVTPHEFLLSCALRAVTDQLK